MKILAVETSTDACSAALWIDGECRQEFALAPREHTKLILPMIDQLMSEAGLRPQQLDAIGLSRGPGSFTGVRIAGAVVQGIAFGADLPVAPVSTLAAIAQDHFNRHPDSQLAFTAMDARMDEIFWGCYGRSDLGLAELHGEEVVTPADQVAFPARTGYGVGSGWGVYQAVLSNTLSPYLHAIEAEVWPSAACIAQIAALMVANGATVPVEQAMPVYLRDKVAKKQNER